MKVELRPGETLTIEFLDTDGEVEVRFDEDAERILFDGKICWEERFVTIGELGVEPEPGELDDSDMPHAL